jgi:hypothetical protein
MEHVNHHLLVADHHLDRGEMTERIICTMEISYGQGPCDEFYIPRNENGQCPEGHRFIDEQTGCVPDQIGLPPAPPPACDPEVEICVCPEGQTGIPPNCQPINCDVKTHHLSVGNNL